MFFDRFSHIQSNQEQKLVEDQAFNVYSSVFGQSSGEHQVLNTESDKPSRRSVKTTYNSSLLQTFNLIKFREDVTDDLDKQEKQFPCDWLVDIRNTGKMFACYDVAQQKRNQKYRFPFLNKHEHLYIYTLIQHSLNRFQTDINIHQLDMVALLKDNEVLSFSFDDVNDSFSMICVQAKDLYIYIIDFINSSVITKVQDRNSIIRKSIFRHYHRRVRTLPKFEMMKEFIQEQESKGNLVLLPKLNQKFVIVYNKKTDLI